MNLTSFFAVLFLGPLLFSSSSWAQQERARSLGNPALPTERRAERPHQRTTEPSRPRSTPPASYSRERAPEPQGIVTSRTHQFQAMLGARARLDVNLRLAQPALTGGLDILTHESLTREDDRILTTQLQLASFQIGGSTDGSFLAFRGQGAGSASYGILAPGDTCRFGGSAVGRAELEAAFFSGTVSSEGVAIDLGGGPLLYCEFEGATLLIQVPIQVGGDFSTLLPYLQWGMESTVAAEDDLYLVFRAVHQTPLQPHWYTGQGGEIALRALVRINHHFLFGVEGELDLPMAGLGDPEANASLQLQYAPGGPTTTFRQRSRFDGPGSDRDDAMRSGQRSGGEQYQYE